VELSIPPVVRSRRSALIAGNAVVLKPSQYTPLRGVIEDMVRGSGFSGRCVSGGLRHAAVGAAVDRRAARQDHVHRQRRRRQGSDGAGGPIPDPVELELGGKDPMLVFDDVDLSRTVNGAMWGRSSTAARRVRRSSGFMCRKPSTTRLCLRWSKKPTTAHPTANQGETDGGQLDIGCMTTEAQLAIVERQLAEAVAQGATVLTGGSRVPGTRIFPPTVVTNVNHSMSIVTDETFGPVVVVMKFKSEAEAIELANDSTFGLSASVLEPGPATRRARGSGDPYGQCVDQRRAGHAGQLGAPVRRSQG